MPLYTFACSCGFSDEYLIRLSERDSKAIFCDLCGKELRRKMDMPVLGKPAYQMQAVTDRGHIPGHFGRAARKR